VRSGRYAYPYPTLTLPRGFIHSPLAIGVSKLRQGKAEGGRVEPVSPPTSACLSGSRKGVNQNMTPKTYTQAEVDAMLAAKAPTVTVKVSAKGGISVYGLQRWPVTLYKSQWSRLFEKRAAIEALFPQATDKA
jgi:hypothetical protein